MLGKNLDKTPELQVQTRKCAVRELCKKGRKDRVGDDTGIDSRAEAIYTNLILGLLLLHGRASIK
jgi:hypothetical protein